LKAVYVHAVDRKACPNFKTILSQWRIRYSISTSATKEGKRRLYWRKIQKKTNRWK